MKKYKTIIIIVFLLFTIFVVYEVNRSSKLPDHIHSIDDKPVGERTDEESLTILERDLQKEPENTKVLMQMADLHVKMGKFDLAKKKLKEIIDIDPANTEAITKLNNLGGTK